MSRIPELLMYSLVAMAQLAFALLLLAHHSGLVEKGVSRAAKPPLVSTTLKSTSDGGLELK